MTEIYLSVKQVARRLGVHPITVKRRITEGKLKAIRTKGDSGAYRISEKALEEALQGAELVEVQS